MTSIIRGLGLLAAASCGIALAGCNAVEDVSEEPTIPSPTPSVVLQGTVSGLGTRRPVVLQNNGVSECADRSGATGEEVAECRFFGTLGQPTTAFSFGSLPAGTPYNITVRTQPFGKVCTVVNGTGTLAAGSAPISVNCVNDPAVPRYSVSGSIAPAVASLPGAKVILTTEDGVQEIPAAGLTQFAFPAAIFDSETSLPIFTWQVTATFNDGQTVNNCAVSNGSNTVAPTGNVTNVAVTACNFSVTAAVTYQAATGQPALAMQPGGMTLALRHQPTGIDVQTLEVTSYSATARAFAQPVQSNRDAVYELVVIRQPAGHTCVVGSSSEAVWVGAVLLLDPTDTTHGWRIARNVRCRAVPAPANRLRGVYQQATIASGGTPPAPVTTTNRNFMAFFEDGTFLYGVHGSGVNAYSTSGVLHGFYGYDSSAGTITFSPLTGFTGAGAGFASPGGTATMTGVTRTPGPRAEISGTVSSVRWLLTEPRAVEGQMSGAWATADNRRIWIFNAVNYNGFHAGVNGLGNVQDGCFNIEDPTASSGFYTRRGNATTCSLGSGMYTLDFPAATTTPRIPLGFYGRWPAAGSNADGRPSSPVNFRIVAGSPDVLTVQETLNGVEAIDGVPVYPPVVMQRITAN